ncbi:amidohydrolase family protein [Streptomyces griseiscabiei]|uniref:Amidohydrolase family protein n=1 Tax=Streptomyces griseiscabiei TaxID=2993540 RepID=A0ABU4L594_9ACTN|nr:amidohydrolase family protein [Streptomyces griseiscabiei]MBZ3901899.1 amidohydrolase [Streptomyces griseiscabiei]MDX2910901.1 amidohydrolase family protein [Streptomyces griseiscabiei]
MTNTPGRIDVHQHAVPPFYRDLLAKAGIAEAGGRALPDWSPEAALEQMALLGTDTAILSVSTPGTGFLADPREAVALARRLNDHGASLAADRPDRFGLFATLPMPDPAASATEAARALDGLGADGVTLLANNQGTYLGAPGQDPLWRVLDDRAAVVLVHPAELPGPSVPGIPPFAADFLLDTSRAAFLLVRNKVVRDHPRIRFVLSHGGGFLPYASHRMAAAISATTGRSSLDVLDDFRSFYFDTALSAGPAALPSLLAFARPGHILFGSDWPFAPSTAGQYFATGLDTGVDATTLAAVNRGNAEALFPRLAGAPVARRSEPVPARLRRAARRRAARLLFKLVQPGGD